MPRGMHLTHEESIILVFQDMILSIGLGLREVLLERGVLQLLLQPLPQPQPQPKMDRQPYPTVQQ
jgi:hypothetical protein